MTWVKLDDQILTHPKILRAGRDARDLFIAGLCYCAAQLTDGVIPLGALRLLGSMADIDHPGASADRLIEVGLWTKTADSYIVHDYLNYQPSRAQAEAVRQARAEAGSKGGKNSVEAKRQANAQANAQATPEANAQAKSKQNSTPYPYPIRSPVDPVPRDPASDLDPEVCVYSGTDQTANPQPAQPTPTTSTHTPEKKTAEKPQNAPPTIRSREPDVLWQAWLSPDGIGRTPAHRGEEREWRTGLRDLARASPDGALTPDELKLRCRRYRERFTTNKQTGEPIPLTMRALYNHWGELGEELQTRGPTTTGTNQPSTTKRKTESPQERFERERAEMEAGYQAIVARQQSQLAASGAAHSVPGLPGARAGPGEAMARPTAR